MLSHDYHPYEFFESTNTRPYGIIILNYSSESLRNLLTRDLWTRAMARACADGGANILRRHADELNERLLPNYISGDFDSIDEQTLRYYKSLPQVEFIRTQDQNATDFSKCVRMMVDKHRSMEHLLVFCSLGGRFDHSMGIIHTLFILNDAYPNLQVYLLAEQDITFLLHANHANRIHVQSTYSGRICSLLPFGQSARVRTRGLKWNLDGSQELSFTKLVSSSNTYESETTAYVDVETDKEIIWTMTYRCEKRT